MTNSVRPLLLTLACVAGFSLVAWLLVSRPVTPRRITDAPQNLSEPVAAEPVSAESDFGLPARVAWTTSRVIGSPEPPPPFRSENAFPKIRFKNPVAIATPPGSDRWFVAEQAGRVFSFRKDRGSEQADLAIDVRDLIRREIERHAASGDSAADKAANKRDEYPVRGLEALYGLTFHPQFATNRYCYLCYVASGKPGEQLPDGTRVSRFTVTDTDPPRCDPDSEQMVITWLQGGHNGGCLAFGPDGCLYISTGDGGFANPPDGRNAGQDVSNLLSSVLRIDVDHPPAANVANAQNASASSPRTSPAAAPAESPQPKHYSIPPDNPFVNLPGARGEIWCYGLRNPWKMSFDRATGDLWVADVGWELWELVFKVQRGGNYGWSIVEGRQPVHPQRKLGPTPILPPTIEIPHTDGVSVTGGFVYRGQKFPELVGTYLFGDWETRRVWGSKWDDATQTMSPMRDLLEPMVRLVSFAEDHDGELLLLDYDDGTMHELVRNDIADRNQEFPRRLSDTGLFTSTTSHSPAPGVIPFSINAEQWADGATAERLVAIPDEGTVRVLKDKSPIAGSMFQSATVWPKNSALVKTFSYEARVGDPRSRRRIETQLLHFDGKFWRGYSYRWNDEQTDAELVEANGMEAAISPASGEPNRVSSSSQTWHFPSRVECARCHNQWAEYALAFNVRQLNKDYLYGEIIDNQLRALEHVGVLKFEGGGQGLEVRGQEELDEARFDVSAFSRLANPYDSAADVNDRARSYLHVNCAHCHRTGGGGTAYIELRQELALEALKALDVRPTQGTFEIPEARILAAGDPFRSTLYYRIAKTGSGRMPHIGSEMVDERGVKLIHDWIRQLPPRSDEIALLDRLKTLDDTEARKQEAVQAKSRQNQLAQKKANERRAQELKAAGNAPSPQPLKPAAITDADRAAAEAQDHQQSDERAAARAKGRAETIRDLLATTSRAARAARAIREHDLPVGVRDELIAVAAARPDPQIRDLFEPFLPPDQRVKRLGSAIRPEALLALPGDAARGRELFFTTAGIACKNCHRIGDTGSTIGPDLSHIGKKFNRAQLLDSILEPSKVIDPKYVGFVVETKDGKVLVGLLTGRTASEIVLRNMQDQEVRLAVEDIEELAPLRKSLMPDLQLKDMTANQVADLLVFLESLK